MMGQEKGNTEKSPKFCRNKELIIQAKGNLEQTYSKPRRQRSMASGLNFLKKQR